MSASGRALPRLAYDSPMTSDASASPATCPRLVVLSLGAGVQSSTLALMAAAGEIKPMPNAAIFADTQDETAKVYRHLEWLETVLPFPVHRVTRGKLSTRLLEGDDEARIPAFVGHGGMATRQCTRNYKIKPIRRKIRELLGVGPRGFIPPGTVSQWIGISTDEASRSKPSGVKFIVNRWPFLEVGTEMSRYQCTEWLFRKFKRVAPKSACRYCPLQGNKRWLKMKESEPYEWQQSIRFDNALRSPENVKRFHGKLYLHLSREPLAVADLTPKPREPDLFANECEGICGV